MRYLVRPHGWSLGDSSNRGGRSVCLATATGGCRSCCCSRFPESGDILHRDGSFACRARARRKQCRGRVFPSRTSITVCRLPLRAESSSAGVLSAGGGRGRPFRPRSTTSGRFPVSLSAARRMRSRVRCRPGFPSERTRRQASWRRGRWETARRGGASPLLNFSQLHRFQYLTLLQRFFADRPFASRSLGGSRRSTAAAATGAAQLVTLKASVPIRVRGGCLLYTSPSPRDKRQSRMPSSA